MPSLKFTRRRLIEAEPALFPDFAASMERCQHSAAVRNQIKFGG
jgi:hypothetical protein